MSIPPAISLPNSPGWSRWIERLRAATAGRFTIIRELGRGGFAAVFLAQQLQPNRRVAIKLLLPAHLDSQWALEHFRGESQKIAEWRHQSVVTIYEVHEVDDLFFFVMSYVEGGSLHELIHMLGPLPVPVVKSVLAQTGSALQYAHRQGVTHRDIKPHNVLVDVDGGAVVTDFGISKQSGGTSHTVTGMIFGTAPYMAPEQCESGTTSFASDQYALGIVAYEMMTGSPPFTGPATSVLMAHLQKPVPMLRTIRPDCPPELEAAVARMLAKDPADRFGSVSEAMAAAGAIELPDYDPQRKTFAQAARDIAARSQAHVLELVSIPPTIEVGDKIPLQASAKTMAGDPIAETEIRWSVDNGAVAKLDEQKGELTALKAGFTTLFIRSGGAEQQVRVDVKAPQAATLQVSGPTAPLKIGEKTRVTATAKSKHGLPVTGPVIWVSEDPKLATVTPEGVLQALGSGRTRIRAQVDSVTSEFWIDVASAEAAEVRVMGSPSSLTVGDRRQLSAVVLDASDQVLTDRNVVWASSDRRVATVSPTGMVTASASGKVTITATCDTHTATVGIAVEESQAVIVEMINPPESLRMGDTTRLRAVARDAQGHTVDRALVWMSDDVSIARVAADGTVTAVAPGNVVVSATIDGVTTAAVIDVTRRISVATAIDPAATSVFGAGARKDDAPADAPRSPVATPAGATALMGAATPKPQPVAAAKPEAKATPKSVAASGQKQPVQGVAVVSRNVTPTAQNATAGAAATSGKPTKSGSMSRIIALSAIAVAAVATFIVMKSGSDDNAVPETPAVTSSAGTTPAGGASTQKPAGDPARTNAERAGAGAPPAAPHTLKILPVTGAFAVGDTFTLHVSGQPSVIAKMRWSSSSKAVATVSSDGVIHALKPGRASIAATSEDLHDLINIEVRANPSVASGGAASGGGTTTTPKVNDPPAVATQQTKTDPYPPPVAVTPPTTVAAPPAATSSGYGSAPVVPDAKENERLVRTLVNEYAAALSSRKLDEAVRLFPKMDASMKNTWKTFFDGGTQMHMQYDVVSMNLRGEAGTASVAGTHEFLMPGRKGKCQMQLTLQLKLEQQSGAWRIAGLDQKEGASKNCK